MAEISAPELDQQLAQARAQLIQLQAAQVQAQADADLSVVTEKRTSQLVTQGWTSAQRGDTDPLRRRRAPGGGSRSRRPTSWRRARR